MTLAARTRTDSGSFIVDSRGTVLAFDQGMERLTHYSAADIVGQSKDRFGRRDLGTSTIARFPRPLYSGELPCVTAARVVELSLFAAGGKRLDVEALVDRTPGPGDRHQVTVLRIVGRTSEPLPEAEGLEGFDPLTGLATRDSFLDAIAIDFECSRGTARPLGLVLIDIDHLSDVNDRLGWTCGDLVLQKLAALLRTRSDEDRIFRVDDDSFAIILPDCGRGDARQLAAGIRSTVERFRFLKHAEGEETQLTVSIGAASYPADCENHEDLLERANDALEEARRMGRNRVWCYVRRPRVPVEAPVYFDGAESLLVGYSRDLSLSGMFIQTAVPLDIGMRFALAFRLPDSGPRVKVIARVVRNVQVEMIDDACRIPGMGVEFELFDEPNHRRAIDAYLHQHEAKSLRPENGVFSL